MGYDGDIVDIMGIFYVVGDILGIRKLDIIRKKGRDISHQLSMILGGCLRGLPPNVWQLQGEVLG